MKEDGKKSFTNVFVANDCNVNTGHTKKLSEKEKNESNPE